MLKDVIADACADALVLLQRFAVKTRADIRPEAWAHDYGIEIVEDDLDGAAAQLIRLGDIVQIVIPARVTDIGARRFSVIHEVDHFLREHPSPTPTMMCTPKALRRGDRALKTCEVHANVFAGAVLLPEFLLRQHCESSQVSLDVPWRIAKEFEVSILASSIRFIELSRERCAAVFSRRGVVEWVATSPSFTRQIRRGKPIDRESLAWGFHSSGKLDERDRPVPASAWLDTNERVDIVEHSTGSREHQTVLSLLWVPDQVGAQLGMP